MLSLLLILFFIRPIVLSSNSEQSEDQRINLFLNAFEDKNTVKDWVKSRNNESSCALDLFESIVKKVKNLLIVINNKQNGEIKSLIMNTNMDLFDLGNAYYEIFIIISSIQSILKYIEAQKSFISVERGIIYFTEVLYEEYDMIYKNLKSVIIRIGLQFNHNETSYGLQYDWMKENNESYAVTYNCLETMNFFNRLNYMLNSTLSENLISTTYVVASTEGFERSRKCFDNGLNLFIREKSPIICQKILLKDLRKCPMVSIIQNKVNIKDFQDKTFICNKTSAKVLMTLFHYYFEIKEKNTVYEIISKKNNEFQIKWSFLNYPIAEEIKQYWMKQEILDLPSKKRFHKFKISSDKKVEYSTRKSDGFEAEPKKARLILLSCGHQKGDEMIDEFFDLYYVNYAEPSMCYTCTRKIMVLGSYDADIYPCK